jgi:hypothetical protein
MRVLVACEFSGVVRRAFLDRGHDAWSCDLLPAEDGSNRHYQCDVRELLEGCGLRGAFDLMIAHPPCTYLTCAAEWAYGEGPYHQRVKPETLVGAARRAARVDSIAFVETLLNCGIPRVCVENPVGVLSRALGRPAQTVQPWMFGDDASKATCLWLKGLPPLLATDRLPGGKSARRANQTASGQNRLSPSPDRWKLRSVTYPGIAAAMADQWGLAA